MHFLRSKLSCGLPSRLLFALALAPALGSVTVYGAGDIPKLTADDAEQGDVFGRSVAISGDVLVAGAEWGNDGSVVGGAAYVYRIEVDGSWLQEQKLTASDSALSDLFGYSVAAEGDTVVVGGYLNETSGSVYVFRFNGQNWLEQARLRPSDETDLAAFGFNVAISGDVIIVGASTDDEAAQNGGAVYLFRRSGMHWEQEAKLVSPQAESWDRFGGSVDIHGDAAVVGAYRDNDAGTNAGAAYVYRHTNGSWQQEAQLLASDATSGDYFDLVFISDDIAGQTGLLISPNSWHRIFTTTASFLAASKRLSFATPIRTVK